MGNMIYPILLLVALTVPQVNPLPPFTENLENEVLPEINDFRSLAASGNMTEMRKNLTMEAMKKLKTYRNSTEEDQMVQEILMAKLKKRDKKKFGPMADMKKLVWNETLVEWSKKTSCPIDFGEEVILDQYNRDEYRNFSYRHVAFTLSFTGAQTIGEAIAKYFEDNIPLMEFVHPPMILENHTNFILGEFYMADRSEIGCTVHNNCYNKGTQVRKLVCAMTPGEMTSEAYIDGEPATKCPRHYVPEDDFANLCMLDPRLNRSQISAIRDAERFGFEIREMVALKQEPDGTTRLVGTLILALVLLMAWK